MRRRHSALTGTALSTRIVLLKELFKPRDCYKPRRVKKKLKLKKKSKIKSKDEGWATFPQDTDASVAMRAAIDYETTLPMVPIVEETLGKITNEQLFNAYQALSRDDVLIVIDSRASYSLTPFIEDFADHLQESTLENLQGLNSTADVKGEGWVEWMIQDYYGTK